jgi:hypothetical protein
VTISLEDAELPSLAKQCQHQTQLFFRKLSHDTRYCFELFRRGFALGLNDALYYIYKFYIPLLSAYAKRHPLFEQSSQDAPFFSRVALANFYKTCHGPRFLTMFPALPAVMAYLYACVSSAVIQDLRGNRQMAAMADDIPDQEPVDEVSGDALWTHIRGVIDEPADEHLAYLRFVLEMPPAEIFRAYPDKWESERAISVALQRIRRRLRKDVMLQQMVGLRPE